MAPTSPPDQANQGAASVVVERRIEWSDVDAAGTIKSSVASRLLESAEAVLFERLGLVHMLPLLPRVRFEADFSGRLRYHDIAEVLLTVEGIKKTSISYRFDIRHVNQVCIRGTCKMVLLDSPQGKPMSWHPRERALLLESGPQRPELLTR